MLLRVLELTGYTSILICICLWGILYVYTNISINNHTVCAHLSLDGTNVTRITKSFKKTTHVSILVLASRMGYTFPGILNAPYNNKHRINEYVVVTLSPQ